MKTIFSRPRPYFQDHDQDQDFKILSRPRPSLVFQTETKTLHLKTKSKTKTFLWCILDADRKAFFIFGRKRKCRRKWNSIYGRKRNENENGHSFSVENENESHPIILVFLSFSYIQSPSQPYNAPPIPRPVSRFLQVGLVDGIPLSSCTVYTYFVAFF